MKSKVDLYDKEEYATLLLLDFAGDEKFYHTHQTFLSPDSIYLVVAKLNEADDKQAKGNKTTDPMMTSFLFAISVAIKLCTFARRSHHN